MFNIDKIVIGFNKIFQNFFIHLIFWYLSLLFFIFLTEDNELFFTYLNFLETDNILSLILIISLLISILFSIFDIIFTARTLRFLPRRLLLFIKSIFYLVSVFLLVIIAAKPPESIIREQNYEQLWQHLPELNIQFIRFLIYFYLTAFLINFLKAVRKKVGRANFKNWMLGLLNKPTEQERIFMFLDMKYSTALAEKLSHRKFSYLIQDVFNDMSIVDNYHGEIYQYLGDGAIITWSIKNGLQQNNFLKAFFAFSRLIEKRRRYYMRKYKTVPEFKAGIHAGKVMVLQVGQIRSDISFNGDTINTAARIEAQCNEHRHNLLISGDLYNKIKNKKGFQFSNAGNIKLKGKKRGVEIYKVRKKKKA